MKPTKGSLNWLIPTLTPKECELIERYLLDEVEKYISEDYSWDNSVEDEVYMDIVDKEGLIKALKKFCTGDQPHE